MEKLNRLAKKYFSEINAESLTQSRLIQTLNKFENLCVWVQIIDQKIRIYHAPTFQFDLIKKNRLDSLLLLLNRILQNRTLQNTEFLVCLSDSIVADFPVLSSISFPNCSVIPIPLGADHGPDGGTSVEGFDQRIKEIYQQNNSRLPIEKKIKKAIFRGALRIKKGIFHFSEPARGKLYELRKKHPEWLDIAYTKIVSQEPSIPESALRFFLNQSQTPLKQSTYIRLADQQAYLANLCVGAWAGWADRIRILLHMDTVTLLHESSCFEYFQPILEEGIHFFRIDESFQNLKPTLEYLTQNPNAAQNTINAANQFAAEYIQEKAFQFYFDCILNELNQRLPYPITEANKQLKELNLIEIIHDYHDKKEK